MADVPTSLPESRLGSTLRRDAWWMEILPVVIVLGGFGVYATLRAFEGAYYSWGPYLSPFYSPLMDPQYHWWPLSPALLVLVGPLGFRATCYYYRKAYYRAFFLDPPACAVGEPASRNYHRKAYSRAFFLDPPACAVGEPANRKYRGETAFPFILQNVHRYFLYLAIVFLVFLWHDAIKGFFFDGHFGIGVGSLILLANVMLLSIYTLSCHSLRHLAGGKMDCFSCASFGTTRAASWRGFSFLNERHMQFAWASLISVGSADLYIRLVASGLIRDLRIL